MKKKNLLPFGTLPGHWGLAGRTREIAKAEYELDGYELQERLLEIDKEVLGEQVFTEKLLDLKLKFSKISVNEYNRATADLITDDTQRELAILKLDLADKKISIQDYEKRVATLKNEPWVTVLKMDCTKASSLEGSFELDWNSAFVAKLRDEGYEAPTDDGIVNQWFMELCRNIALEEFDGTGNFTADSEANLQAVKGWSSPPIRRS